jgi:hypothetical protein
MGKYAFDACIIGNLTPRQKAMTTKFLRDSSYKIIAMDEYNATVKKLPEMAAYLIVFDVGNALEDPDFFDRMIIMGWTVNRIKVEDEDFELNTFPVLDVKALP